MDKLKRLVRRLKELDALSINLLVLYAFNFIWSFGNPLINVNTSIVAYFTNAGAQVSVIGILQICVNLPIVFQFFPRFIKLKASGKILIPIYGTVGLGFILYGALAAASPGKPGVIIPIMHVLYFVIYVFFLLGNILYFNILARLVPGNMMGRYYGTQSVLMSIGSVVGGIMASFLLKSFLFPSNYSLLFTVAGAIFIVSTLTLLLTREDKSIRSEPEQTFKSIPSYAMSLSPCLRRPAVRNFLLLSAFVYAAAIPFNFAMVYYGRELGAPISPSVIILMPYLAQSVLIPLIGVVMDKFGHARAIGVYAFLLLAMSCLLISRWPHGWLLVFGIFGAYPSFINMTRINMVREVAQPEEIFDLLLISNISGVIVTTAISTVFSWILDRWNAYTWMFVFFGFVSAAILLLQQRQKRLITDNYK